MSSPRTSETHPIDAHFVSGAALPSKGAVGFCLAPGRKGPGRAGLHDRDLEEDVGRLRTEFGVDVVVSLVTDAETAKRTGVPTAVEQRVVERFGMVFRHVPVEPGHLPDEVALTVLVRRLRNDLAAGRKIVVHDRAGGGRSAAVIAALLVGLGHSASEAVAIVRAMRPKAVDPSQVSALAKLAPRLVQRTSPLLATVESAMQGLGLACRRVPGTDTLESIATVDGRSVNFVVATEESLHRVIVEVPTGPSVPVAGRAAVGELLHRLNWPILLGGFVMNLGDGQVRFRAAVDVEGGTLTAKMLANLVTVSVQPVASYSGAISLVANAGFAPAEALAQAPREPD